jgi:hypothetical protein
VRKLSQERWQRVEPILDRALELPPEKWSAFLDEACAGDPILRADAESLLETERQAPQFLEAPAASFVLQAAQAMPAPQSPHIGALIGPYRIVRELGRGGMGTVYLAERADGQFDQRLALKLIRGGAASDDVVRRFLHERFSPGSSIRTWRGCSTAASRRTASRTSRWSTSTASRSRRTARATR